MIEMLVGGGLVFAGSILGMAYASFRRSKPQKPICGCHHSLAMHDPETGICNASVQQYTSEHGTGSKLSHVPCGCRQYVGPLPAEMMLAQFRPKELG